MALSALIGIAALLSLITINLTDRARVAAIVIFVATGILFMVSAAAAVFGAARDTYRGPGSGDTQD